MDNDITRAATYGAVLVVGGLGIDFVMNGPNSILGRLLGQKVNANQPFTEAPLKFGETSTSPYEVPVPTLRAPIPESTHANTDSSGALEVPIRYKKKDKSGLQMQDIDAASWEIAKTVFEDMAPYDPSVKITVGSTQKIHDDLIHIFNSHDCPEILIKLAHFHATHGHNIYKPGSVLYATQQKMVGTAADMYEDFIGIHRMYSRTGDLNASEYDKDDDRLAAMGQESPIFFKVQGGWSVGPGSV